MGVNFGNWKLVIKQSAPDNKKANIHEQTVELYKLSGDHTGEEKQVNNSRIKNKLILCICYLSYYLSVFVDSFCNKY